MKGFNTLRDNPILNGALDIHAPRQEVVQHLMEAVDYQRVKAADVLVYRFGFLRLPFASNRLQDGFNLHVWIDDLPRDKFPHTHIFDARSRVMLRSIIDVEWNVSEAGDGAYKRLQPLYSDGQTRDHELPGAVNIEERRRNPVQQDGVYEVQKGTFHSSKVPSGDDPTVTLFQKYNIDANAHPINIVLIDRPPEKKFDLLGVPQGRAWQILGEVLECL